MDVATMGVGERQHGGCDSKKRGNDHSATRKPVNQRTVRIRE
jgi:hypothetical protein